MLRSLSAAGAGLLIVLTGCGTATSTANTTAAASPAHAVKTLPPGCAEDLAAIPYASPVDSAQADGDQTAMEAASHSQAQATRATMLASEAAAFASLASGMWSAGGDATGDLNQWDKVLKQMRSYCS